jgi:hypothetical protein
MSRFNSHGAVALPALLILLGTSAAVTWPAQAANTWSAPVALPAGAGSASFAENASGAQIAVTGTGPQVSSSANGKTWSAPAAIATGGTDAAVALAANGRAVVVWHGGTAAAPLLQASTQAAPGATWSAPVTIGALNVGAQAPVIGVDGSGNTIVAWAGSTALNVLGPVFTASLPAGGTWTAVRTLDASAGSVVRMAVDSTGSAIVTWGEPDEIVADSGTILGGFGAPVNIGMALEYEHIPRTSQVAINSAGQAVLAYTPQSTIGMVATRSASGTWTAAAPLACSGAANPVIDSAGNAMAICAVSAINAQGEPVTTLETTRLPAGSTTWGTPVPLATGTFVGDYAAADAAGTIVVAWVTDIGVVNNMNAETLSVVTSPPGGSFGAATTFTATGFLNADLNVAPGQATLLWNVASSGAVESTEPVS